MTRASKENNVTYMGQDLYKQMENNNWQKLDRRTDMRKVPDVPGNMELFVNVIGMYRSQPGRLPQYKVLHIVCSY